MNICIIVSYQYNIKYVNSLKLNKFMYNIKLTCNNSIVINFMLGDIFNNNT